MPTREHVEPTAPSRAPTTPDEKDDETPVRRTGIRPIDARPVPTSQSRTDLTRPHGSR